MQARGGRVDLLDVVVRVGKPALDRGVLDGQVPLDDQILWGIAAWIASTLSCNGLSYARATSTWQSNSTKTFTALNGVGIETS